MKKIFKLVMFLLLTLVLFVCVNIGVSAETSGDWTYTIDFSDDSAEITGYTGVEEELVIPSEIDGYAVKKIGSNVFKELEIYSVDIPDTVTAIGESAFYGCQNLCILTIGMNVEDIGNQAFANCLELELVNWNAKNAKYKSYSYLFENSGSAGIGITVVFGNNVESIPRYLFNYNAYLKSITIGKNVKEIDTYTFNRANVDGFKVEPSNQYFCSEAGVLFNKEKTEILSYPNGKTDLKYSVPDGVLNVGSYAFYAADNLTEIIIPNGVETIGWGAFYNCSGIEKITIPESVKSIENRAFEYCSKLSNIILPDGLENVNKEVFINTLYWNTESNWKNGLLYIGNYLIASNENCGNVISIKKGTKYICHGVFNIYDAGKSLYIPESVEFIGNNNFGYESTWYVENLEKWLNIQNEARYNYSELIFTELDDKKLVIPDNITDIPQCAFYNCKTIESVVIPKSVKTIGENAFGGCDNITDVYISDVESWCSIVFAGYDSLPTLNADNVYFDGKLLTEIVIPDNVSKITSKLFINCPYVEEITMPFVGLERESNKNFDSVLGYMFGYVNDEEKYNIISQKYNDTESRSYSIPKTLKKVTITDAKVIPYGAFSNCESLEEINIKGNGRLLVNANAFLNCYNLTTLKIIAPDLRYAKSNIFEGADFVRIYGESGSPTEKYANEYGYDFESITNVDEYELNAEAEVVDNKIVVYADTLKNVEYDYMHIALYNSEDVLVDYILVPCKSVYNNTNVIFEDNKNAAYAKIFLWKGNSPLEPAADALKVIINRAL